jgi:hypothetical protein
LRGVLFLLPYLYRRDSGNHRLDPIFWRTDIEIPCRGSVDPARSSIGVVMRLQRDRCCAEAKSGRQKKYFSCCSLSGFVVAGLTGFRWRHRTIDQRISSWIWHSLETTAWLVHGRLAAVIIGIEASVCSLSYPSEWVMGIAGILMSGYSRPSWK